MSENWEELLPYVLAHEYHHSVWTSRNFKTADFTTAEYLVFEGRADAFASASFPDISVPWTDMIDEDTERNVWKIIKPELHKRKAAMNDNVMTGTNEIPFGSGYTIGFNIVQSYKTKNPHLTDSMIIDMDPMEILRLSDYGHSLPGIID